VFYKLCIAHGKSKQSVENILYMYLSEFIQEVSKLPIKVGSVNGGQQRFIQDFLKSHPEVKHILETGFHVGLSAAIMMEARPDISVTSFDIFWFDYTRKAKLLLDIAYPGRNTLVAGNSINTLPTFFTQNTCSPDFVFIDGGHEHPIPYIDLYYILNHVKPGTYIMIDDYCMEHGQQGVIGAVNRFIELGVIAESQVYKSEDRGWVFGYRSSLPMPPSDVDISKEAIDKLLRDTESHYSEAQGAGPQTMDFTFGIVTDGKDIQGIVDSIHSQNIPNYEIIVIGNTDVKGVIQIPFDETKPLTKKKNLIAQLAKYENIVLLHDYVKFSPGWYEGFLTFGNSFQVCVNKIVSIDGQRFRDHVLFKECIPKIETLLPYGCEITPAVSKLLYISGTYYVIKKKIALENPLDERLGWSQGEDVLFSQSLSKKGILIECNPFSTVTLTKEKDFWEKEMSSELYTKLCIWAETHGEEAFQAQTTLQEEWCKQFY